MHISVGREILHCKYGVAAAPHKEPYAGRDLVLLLFVCDYNLDFIHFSLPFL